MATLFDNPNGFFTESSLIGATDDFHVTHTSELIDDELDQDGALDITVKRVVGIVEVFEIRSRPL